EFAETFDLPIVEVITEDGVLVNSSEFDGMPAEEAKRAIVRKLHGEGRGAPAVSHRLRDWSFGRQRYWGCPIPIIHCPDCGEGPSCGGGGIRGGGHGPAGQQRRVAQRSVPALRRPRAAGGGHDGYLRGLVLVLPALRRSPQRRGAVRPAADRLLVPDRPLHRR